MIAIGLIRWGRTYGLAYNARPADAIMNAALWRRARRLPLCDWCDSVSCLDYSHKRLAENARERGEMSALLREARPWLNILSVRFAELYPDHSNGPAEKRLDDLIARIEALKP